MSDLKLNKSNIPKSNYNLAVVSHCPNQQTATIVIVEKPSVFGIFKSFGISNKDKKTSDDWTRSKTTFFICKRFFPTFIIITENVA